ncbi:AAA family ATPase [Polyangium spumosum]|uniref:AAA family ATPase n=1 Tax=Polyangium spumosum TaxID=889282 RepID=UPI001479135A
MITSIRVASFRGIRAGGLEGLSPLTVILGPNSAGKSTLLDGMVIGGSRSPGDAVGRVVARRSELWDGARWLFWRGGRDGTPATIQVNIKDIGTRNVTLSFSTDVSSGLEQKLDERRARRPFVGEVLAIAQLEGARARTAFALDNEYVFEQEGGFRRVPLVKLVDPRPGARHALLSRVYTEAVESGLLDESVALVSAVVPGLRNIVLTDPGGATVVQLQFADHSVPVALAGDGVQSLVRICFELASPAGSTALLEEPEASQHPRALRQTARAIRAAVQRGVQVVLSTHSLDLLDALLLEFEAERPALTVFHLALHDGELRSTRYEGAEAAFAREGVGEDLR